jgi:hypothetical protein
MHVQHLCFLISQRAHMHAHLVRAMHSQHLTTHLAIRSMHVHQLTRAHCVRVHCSVISTAAFVLPSVDCVLQLMMHEQFDPALHSAFRSTIANLVIRSPHMYHDHYGGCSHTHTTIHYTPHRTTTTTTHHPQPTTTIHNHNLHHHPPPPSTTTWLTTTPPSTIHHRTTTMTRSTRTVA